MAMNIPAFVDCKFAQSGTDVKAPNQLQPSNFSLTATHTFAPSPSHPTNPPSIITIYITAEAPAQQTGYDPAAARAKTAHITLHCYCFLPAEERSLAGHRFLRPFLRRSFSTRRPVVLCMRVRNPEVRRRALQHTATAAAARKLTEQQQ